MTQECTSSKERRHIVFNEVPPHAIEYLLSAGEQVLPPSPRICAYDKNKGLLVFKTPIAVHELPIQELRYVIQQQVRRLKLHSLLAEMGRTSFKSQDDSVGKEPDLAWKADIDPEGTKERKWPQVTIEVGNSETGFQLKDYARFWLVESAGGVKYSLTLDLLPNRISLISWGLKADDENEVEVRTEMTVTKDHDAGGTWEHHPDSSMAICLAVDDILRHLTPENARGKSLMIKMDDLIAIAREYDRGRMIQGVL